MNLMILVVTMVLGSTASAMALALWSTRDREYTLATGSKTSGKARAK